MSEVEETTTLQEDPATFKQIAERHKEILIASLRRYVKELGLPEVERRTGISQAQIAQYISGRKSAPTLITLIRMARGLNTSVSNLIGDNVEQADLLFPDQQENLELIAKLLHSKTEELELMLRLLSLHGDTRNAIFQIIRASTK